MHSDVASKEGWLVTETFLNKHSNSWDVNARNLLIFGAYPGLIDVSLTEENAEEVTKHMPGATDSSCVNSSSFRLSLLKHSRASTDLRKIIVSLAE